MQKTFNVKVNTGSRDERVIRYNLTRMGFGGAARFKDAAIGIGKALEGAAP